MATAESEAAPAAVDRPSMPLGPVVAAGSEDRGWGPTLLLCAAVLLSAVLVVVAKPLTAGASSSRVPHATGAGRGHRIVPVATDVATSPNWSGYVAYAGTGSPNSIPSSGGASFDQVSAQWVEPTVTCPKKDAWTLFWVGFDGWPSSDASVEQGGTSAQCVHGVPQYSAFYEMWPTGAVQTAFPVYPGDQIAASVISVAAASGPPQFVITVTDLTPAHQQTVSKTETCAAGLTCPRTSAEWVAESPSHFGTTTWFPLANYRTMTFTDATTTNAEQQTGPIASPSLWADSGIDRVASTPQALAKVSTLQTADGVSAFSDTWQRK